jgi:enamine deaminase RidA (YjgF/YER057c/UK114 family)
MQRMGSGGRLVDRGGGAFEEIAAYSRAVRTGPLISVSATAATDANGAALHPDDAYRQAMVCFERSLAAVERLGGARGDVSRTRLYLAPEADWREAVRAHAEVFRGIDPANTTLFVAGFIPEGVLLEVELDAWVAAPAETI